MKIAQEIKDRVKVELQTGAMFETSNFGAEVHILKDDHIRDGSVKVHIGLAPDEADNAGHWVEAEDCLELSVFFKKLAKKLQKAAL